MGNKQEKSKVGQLVTKQLKAKGKTQLDLAHEFDMPLATFNQKLIEGRLTENERIIIARFLKMDVKKLHQAMIETVVDVGDVMQFLTTHVIRVEAMQTTILSTQAMILSELIKPKKPPEHYVKLLKEETDRNAVRLTDELK